VWRSDAPAALAGIDFSSTRADIAALDALGKEGDWEFDGVTLHVTNLDKVLFPGRTKGEAPLTKRDLIRYYAMVAPVMAPYLERPPLNMHRFPNGADKPGFWHKSIPSHAPEWITQWRYEDADEGETEWYFVADRPATIAWLRNYGGRAPRGPPGPEGAATDLRADRRRPRRERRRGTRCSRSPSCTARWTT
jgi:bifunctional non-homologous end joining protein LigD